ncbi:hypothetical protein [Streptomyces kronopolitis]|uniref:hypothetical protein n=1 Tax=Streptomyces kronopolitis TaxID=1612435 RepID=UPI0036789C5E
MTVMEIELTEEVQDFFDLNVKTTSLIRETEATNGGPTFQYTSGECGTCPTNQTCIGCA